MRLVRPKIWSKEQRGLLRTKFQTHFGGLRARDPFDSFARSLGDSSTMKAINAHHGGTLITVRLDPTARDLHNRDVGDINYNLLHHAASGSSSNATSQPRPNPLGKPSEIDSNPRKGLRNISKHSSETLRTKHEYLVKALEPKCKATQLDVEA
ncbi:hypothetical protein CC78DRAFT_143245 [Lojkania enalia]|uniref:Uncharacterized protein n=1 Tax=Lojkania enalia TaxID=147567 RepID=A0A9P4N0Y4_9PLEO|nr:hypothetical protein CC78DRAFT_143245 [Didymosphaeria enalia]